MRSPPPTRAIEGLRRTWRCHRRSWPQRSRRARRRAPPISVSPGRSSRPARAPLPGRLRRSPSAHRGRHAPRGAGRVGPWSSSPRPYRWPSRDRVCRPPRHRGCAATVVDQQSTALQGQGPENGSRGHLESLENQLPAGPVERKDPHRRGVNDYLGQPWPGRVLDLREFGYRSWHRAVSQPVCRSSTAGCAGCRAGRGAVH